MSLAAAPRPLRSGVIYGLIAYSSWGLVPLYFTALPGVSPWEMLAHRVAWTLLLMVALLAALGLGGKLRAALANRRIRYALTVSALLVAANWYVYVYAVTNKRIAETSLGYFICPLVSVALGSVWLRERLRPWQWVAIGLAAVGVGVLVFAAGHVPVIALFLAVSFSLYSLIRKRVPVDGLTGLAVETLVLLPLAVGYLAVMATRGELSFAAIDRRTDVLLALSGVVTALPLVCFAQAARRLPLSLLGLMQYLSPTCQFALAVYWFQEPFTTQQLVGFLWIWAGLALFTVDALRALAGPKASDVRPVEEELSQDVLNTRA